MMNEITAPFYYLFYFIFFAISWVKLSNFPYLLHAEGILLKSKSYLSCLIPKNTNQYSHLLTRMDPDWHSIHCIQMHIQRTTQEICVGGR